MTHPLAHIRRILHSPAQLLFGGEIELAQQALLPAIPQVFVGGADIGNGQADQIVQTILRLYLFGKLLDHFRILDITALGGDRHQQMMAHQPGDQLGFARVKTVELGEFQHILRAEN